MSDSIQNEFTDDPRITAYALGELEGADLAEVEALVERDADARRLVDEVRETAGALAGELALVGGPGLTDEQRAEIERSSRIAQPAEGGKILRMRPMSAAAMAAGLLAVVGIAAVQQGWFGPAGDEEVAFRYDLGDGARVAPSESADSEYYRAFSTGGTNTSDNKMIVGRSGAVDGLSQLESLGYAGGPEAGAAVAPNAATRPAPKLHRRDERSALRSLGYIGDEEEVEIDGETYVYYSEDYETIEDNPFLLAARQPLSTFSIDVDTASYSNVRRFLSSGTLPPPAAVRIEELVNYFRYDYEPPQDERPFAVHVEVGAAPWEPEHRLVRIGLKGREVFPGERKPANIVFLLDVSGSMDDPNKLALVKRSLALMVQELDERDRVAIVVYAGASGLVLPSTTCDYKEAILQSLEQLDAGGSTNGGAGIELAYSVAQENFVRDGINRVILATDGDFNVGISDDAGLEALIAEKARSGVFLSVLGFGMGNLQDAKLEKLSNRGNGNFAYIDSLLEARKVLVEELGSTLETIAKDVKIQVDFNSSAVKAYRLIGYENRLLAAQDFRDDTKDAGEIGAGHTVTALYEVCPAHVDLDVATAEPSKYATEPEPSEAAFAGELLEVRLRYKLPDGDTSTEFRVPVTDGGGTFFSMSDDSRFAAAVAAFGMVLRDSEFKGEAAFDRVRAWASEAAGDDEGGYREAFLELVRKAENIQTDGR